MAGASAAAGAVPGASARGLLFFVVLIRAIASRGTANTFHALLFGFDHVKSRKTDDQHDRTDQNIISKSHKTTSILTKVQM